MVKVIKDGKVVMQGRNLEPILRYQRQRGVHVSSVAQHGKRLSVRYNDGARVTTRFADPKVLAGWIVNRQKSGIFPRGR